MNRCDIGLIGLAVMGENLAMNMQNKGFRVAVYNRTVSKVYDFINGRAKGLNFYGADSVEDFCAALKTPRKIFLMVKAGEAVDATINSLLPYLSQNDIIIDGGNSNYADTVRREKYLAERGILFIGSGVSGGEEGALNGPSLMPGGNKAAWKEVKPFFEAISAKVNINGKEEACTTWIGNGGAGHFVKMVHNGIEYGDMQVICEGYDIAKRILKMDNSNIADMFVEWNKGRLGSYLIEITGNILKEKENNSYIVDKILDTAGQKGTGKWTAITALDEGIPLNLITDSVFSRYISAQKLLRTELAKIYKKESKNNESAELNGINLDAANNYSSPININTSELEAAIYASKLISYAQGFELIMEKSAKEGWNINPGEVAAIWRGGCIIRSVFLNDITKAYNSYKCSENKTDTEKIEGNSNGEYSRKECVLQTLLLSDFYKTTLPSAIQSLRKVVAIAALNGIPALCMSGALSYYDAITSENLPANLLQAQRDYFGAHTFERTDAPMGKFFHHLWND